MGENNFYSLPDLPYDYDGLEPIMSREQLSLHHTKHHNAYVTGANALLKKFDESKASGNALDEKAAAKALSFQIGGHLLHSLFWRNLISQNSTAKEPDGELARLIAENFGGNDKFKQRFTDLAQSIEGSGWAALIYCRETGRLLLSQIEKHNQNVSATLPILLVLDMFEHAYYVDYKNDEGKYIEGFWLILDWSEVERRLSSARAEK